MWACLTSPNLSYFLRLHYILCVHAVSGSFSGILAAKPAFSVVNLTDKDGRTIGAYELAFKLNVVALTNSVSNQEILDFKKGCSKYCGLKLGFRSSIKVLQNASWIKFLT